MQIVFVTFVQCAFPKCICVTFSTYSCPCTRSRLAGLDQLHHAGTPALPTAHNCNTQHHPCTFVTFNNTKLQSRNIGITEHGQAIDNEVDEELIAKDDGSIPLELVLDADGYGVWCNYASHVTITRHMSQLIRDSSARHTSKVSSWGQPCRPVAGFDGACYVPSCVQNGKGVVDKCNLTLEYEN